MVVFSPGPYLIDLEYEVNDLSHHAVHSCDVDSAPTIGQDFATINLASKSGSPVPADTWVGNLVSAIDEYFESGETNFIGATLWRYEIVDNTRTFISEMTLGLPGDSASPYRAAGQVVFTWRSGNGGILKYNLMETSAISNDVLPLGSIASGPAAELRDLFLSAGSCVLARDGGYPIAALRHSVGENEAIWRKRFRP
jgi:hypothetical protein